MPTESSRRRHIRCGLVYVGMDVRAKFGDSRLNRGRIIRLFGRQDPFYALLWTNRKQLFSLDNPVKYRDPRLNLSREIPHIGVGGDIFDGYFQDKFLPEVVSDVTSGVVVDPSGVKVRVKFGDSRSNRSRDIGRPQMSDGRRRHRPTPGITGQNAVVLSTATLELLLYQERQTN